MSATTRWRDTQTSDLEEILNKLKQDVPDETRTASTYWINFHKEILFPNDKEVRLNDDSVVFNMVHYRYDQITVQDTQAEDRPLTKSGNIIVYKYRETIYYIVDQNSRAKKLLRKLLKYTDKNEISENGFDFREDFFVWLVNRVYNSDAVIESASSNNAVLTLEEIKGIRGDTEDQQTKVSASGESVMNVISTLSFLLESSKLNQVILNLSYTGHENICVKLQKTTVEYQRPYHGEFENDSNNEMTAKLYLLLYLEILPMLEQEYRTNIEDDIWNQEAYVKFLNGLKDIIIDKIENKITSINKNDYKSITHANDY